MNLKHISEDELELYAVGRISVQAAEHLEAHLLGCSKCREQLESMDEYVRAMRMASVRIGREELGCTVEYMMR